MATITNPTLTTRGQAISDRFEQLERARERAGVKMICSYRGETVYEYRGVRYTVRHRCCDMGHYAPGVYCAEIIPFTGCIRGEGPPAWESFPPADLCELFPDYVPARLIWHREPRQSWSDASYVTEYKGARGPDLVKNTTNDGWTVRCVAEFNVHVLKIDPAEYLEIV